MMCSNALNSRGKPEVSLMSGAPTFDIEEKPETGRIPAYVRSVDTLTNRFRHIKLLQSRYLFYCAIVLRVDGNGFAP